MHKNILRKQGGFTLLELLIVIVIIGILAVLIVPNLISGPQRARDSQRKSDLRNIKTALETYYNDNNTYPDSSGWEADLEANGAYIKDVPEDPKSKSAYAYTPSCTGSVCDSYTISATLENSRDPEATNGTYTVSSAN